MASFQIFQDQENRESELRRPQKQSQVHGQRPKRAVLGILVNNNGHRPKAVKPLKQPLQGENGGRQNVCKQKSQIEIKKSFTIHEEISVTTTEVREVQECEASTSATSKQSECSIPSNITALHRAPLLDITSRNNEDFNFDDSLEISSPMSVDKSIQILQTPDKKPKIKEPVEFSGLEEYKIDIYKYMRESETLHRPRAYYMKRQPDITYSMRSILVDWLVEVAEEYKLQAETLYLAVSYIDRFLSSMSVVRAKLQLVGTAAMFIAAKYEEIYPPDVGEFVYITDDTYTKKQVLRMEHLILKVLCFDLSAPTVLTFITTCCSVMDDTKDTAMYLAMYLTELSMLEGDPFLQFLPSLRAAAAVVLARHTLSFSALWPQEMEEASGYTLGDLKLCISYLSRTFEAAATYPQQAIREKFKANRWHSVALLDPRPTPVC